MYAALFHAARCCGARYCTHANRSPCGARYSTKAETLLSAGAKRGFYEHSTTADSRSASGSASYITRSPHLKPQPSCNHVATAPTARKKRIPTLRWRPAHAVYPRRFERPTPRLGGACSIQLSYGYKY